MQFNPCIANARLAAEDQIRPAIAPNLGVSFGKLSETNMQTWGLGPPFFDWYTVRLFGQVWVPPEKIS